MNTLIKQNKSIIPDTSKYIVSVARKLFSDFTYLGVSMDDISKKLHISKAALYYHFTSKNEIYEKVLEEVFQDLKLSIEKAYEEKKTDKKLDVLIQNYLEFGFKEKNIIKALVLSSGDSSVSKRVGNVKNQIIKLVEPIIAEINSKRKFAKKVDNHLAATLLICMMDGLIIDYSFANKKINSAKVSDQIIAVLFTVNN